MGRGQPKVGDSYFEDEEEEFPPLPLPAHLQAKEVKKEQQEEEEDADELDAFMAGIESTVLWVLGC